MRQCKRLGWGVVLFCLMGFTGTVQAAFDSTQPATSDQRSETLFQRYHVSSVIDKFSRGVGNLLVGWLELPAALQREYQPKDPAPSMVRGTVVGLGKALARTGVGLYETVTFWLPYPPDFRPILPLFDYAQERSSKPAPSTAP